MRRATTMSTATIDHSGSDLARIEQAAHAEQAKAAANYAELLAAVEAGEPIDERQALKILRAAGKTTADANAELARRRRAAELREKIAAAGDLVQRGCELREREEALKRELEETTKRLAAELAAVRALVARYEVQLQGRTDPAVSRAEATKHETRLAELKAQREQLGPIHVVNMFQVRSANNAIAACQRALDEAAKKAQRDQPYAAQFRQLAALRRQLAELEAAGGPADD